MVDRTPDFVRELWLEVRPRALEQSDRVCRLAQSWSDHGDPRDWDALVVDVHQLAGSLGSFGQRAAADAAEALDRLVRDPSPDPAAIVGAATALQSEVART